MLADLKLGYDSAKAAIDIVKGIQSLKTTAEINGAVIDIQQKLLDTRSSLMAAQETHSADLKRIGDLEQKIVQLKAWDADKERYNLTQVASGAFTYAPKPGMENGEPPHWLCATCYENKKKSYLQKAHSEHRRPHIIYKCQECNGQITVPFQVNPGSESGSRTITVAS